MVVANRADHFEPTAILVLQLHKAARNSAAAARCRDVRIATRIGGPNFVVEDVEAVSHGVLPVSNIKA